MSILSLADFNGVVPWVVRRLVGTDTVPPGGHPLVDQVNEAGTFAGHARGLSHGHGQSQRFQAIDEAAQYKTENGAAHPIWTITRDGREVARFVAASQPGGGWAVIDYSLTLSGETCALIGA